MGSSADLADFPFETLINLPWKRGGNTRQGCDCWGIVQMVYEIAGKDAPVVPAEAAARVAACRASFEDIAPLDGTQLVEVAAGEPLERLDICVSRDDDGNVHVSVVVHPAHGLALTSTPRLGSHYVRLRDVPGLIGFWRPL